MINTGSSNHGAPAQVPGPTERTGLLDSTRTSYNNDDRSERAINISTSQDPAVPLAELTDHIQHLLVFGQHREDRSVSQESSSTTLGKNRLDRAIPDQRTFPIPDGEEEGLTREIEPAVYKSKKRDFIAGALRFATDQWMENQGITNDMIHESINSDDSSPFGPPVTSNQQPQSGSIPQPMAQPHDESVKDVWDVAKNASVCAVLGLLSERRQGKVSITADVDVTLQRLALSTLEHGIKQTSAKDMVRQEMLFKPWLGDKSAIQWAVENDFTLFLNDDHVQTVIKQSWLYGDANWKSNPNHPLQVWNTSHTPTTTITTLKEDWKTIFTRQFIASYLARWASPRYQCLIAFSTALVYLAFHLTTLANVEYMEDHMRPFEYFYYALVTSDFILELWKVAQSPLKALQTPSTYLTLPTAILLFASFIVRILALFTLDLQPKYHGFYLSFVLLAVATPLMFFRMFIWTDALWWRVYKINYVVGRCFAQSIWVFVIGFIGFIGFWVGLSAVQRDDVGPWQMLLYLVLGAVRTPEINGTLHYQPQVGGFLLVGYLFVIFFLVGALLVASFLSTILSLTRSQSSLDSLRRRMVAERSARPASYGVFIPNVSIEMVMATVVCITRKVRPNSKLVLLERLRQIVWFTLFSPIILAIALIDLTYYILYSMK